MDLQQQIDDLRGNHEELVRTINELSTDVNNKIKNCWNKDNFKRGKGNCTVSVTPARLGISQNSITKYEIIGRKCYIDMYLLFDGTGISGTVEPVKIHVLPFPGVVDRATLPIVHLANTTNTIAGKSGYINLQTIENWGQIRMDKGGPLAEDLTTADIKNGTAIRSQFWYEIAVDEKILS